jgi:hypothetical protein
MLLSRLPNRVAARDADRPVGRAPRDNVNQWTSKDLRDFHILTGEVLETAHRGRPAGFGPGPAWLSEEGAMRTLDPPKTFRPAGPLDAIEQTRAAGTPARPLVLALADVGGAKVSPLYIWGRHRDARGSNLPAGSVPKSSPAASAFPAAACFQAISFPRCPATIDPLVAGWSWSRRGCDSSISLSIEEVHR